VDNDAYGALRDGARRAAHERHPARVRGGLAGGGGRAGGGELSGARFQYPGGVKIDSSFRGQ
jgi:hypothetical protein